MATSADADSIEDSITFFIPVMIDSLLSANKSTCCWLNINLLLKRLLLLRVLLIFKDSIVIPISSYTLPGSKTSVILVPILDLNKLTISFLINSFLISLLAALTVDSKLAIIPSSRVVAVYDFNFNIILILRERLENIISVLSIWASVSCVLNKSNILSLK